MVLIGKYKADCFIVQLSLNTFTDTLSYIILRINRDKTLAIHFKGDLPISDKEYLLARLKIKDIEAIVWYYKCKFNLRHAKISVVVGPNVTLSTGFENNSRLIIEEEEEDAKISI